jgi:hypothetical protein
VLVELAADLLPEVDVTDSLLHHGIHRVECGLDVLVFGPKKIANHWDAVALLCLLDVLEIVQQLGFLELVGVRVKWHRVLFVVVVVVVEVHVLEGNRLSKLQRAATYFLHNSNSNINQ